MRALRSQGRRAFLGKPSGLSSETRIRELLRLYVVTPGDRKEGRTACFPLSMPTHPSCAQLWDSWGQVDVLHATTH